MKKAILIITPILIIIALTIISYNTLSAEKEVTIIDDPFVIQANIDATIKSYGYTLDNPNIKINPYGSSPLTAIISFDTNEEVPVTVKVIGKEGAPILTHTFPKTKHHHLPIYNLYPNYDNQVTINTPNKNTTVTIKTETIPQITVNNDATPNPNELIFISDDNYTYAYDHNKDIKWFLEDYHIPNQLTKLKYNHILISSNKLSNNNRPISLLEIDLLGKIYREYIIKEDYYGVSSFVGNNIYLLSKDKLVKLDPQTGKYLDTYPLPSSNYKYLTTTDNNNLLLTNDKETTTLNLDTKEVTHQDYISYSNYLTMSPYNDEPTPEIKPVRFNALQETPTTKSHLSTLFVSKPDAKYKSYNIKITKDFNRLTLTGNFPNTKNYLILDQFLGQKVYTIKEGNISINNTNLKGKYSIYLKIGNTTYNTNQYIKF